MQITTIGIDLAKNVFQIHRVDERGKPVFMKQMKRDQMASFFANLPPCLIGMDARAGPANSDSEISDSFALPTARKGHEEEQEHGKKEAAESLCHV